MSKLADKLMMGAAGAAGDKLYVEDVFSTYLYDGNDSVHPITNGIDLSGEGGLVWQKARTQYLTLSLHHILTDTERGVNKILRTNTTDAESYVSYGVNTFNSDGFTLNDAYIWSNSSATDYTSWTFRKAEKFFDVVTYTGNGTAGRTVAHNLGSVPGCIIVKRTNSTSDWTVYHRTLSNTQYLKLNLTVGTQTSANIWSSTTPTDTEFTLGSDADVNSASGTYVAYLFAHDAGGFGNDGTESVIKCGSFTYSSGVQVDLGWEPQWILTKTSSTGGDWFVVDTQRQWTADGNANWVLANSSAAETVNSALGLKPTATGFEVPSGLGTGATLIYIAIRRGPMKTPEDATTVFKAVEYSGNSSANLITTGLDMRGGGGRLHWIKILTGSNDGTGYAILNDLTGSQYLDSSTSSAESSLNIDWGVQDWIKHNSNFWNSSGNTIISWNFRRSPGLFDIVAYTGTGVARTIAHNLGVAPELIIIKNRSAVSNWIVYGGPVGLDYYGTLQSNEEFYSGNSALWNSTSPTSSVFSIGSSGALNTNGATYISYLFATLPGVSKVGSYTGTGSDINVDCGFTSGSRFILIKRTDTRITTGFETNWYVWDHVRGIVSGNDNSLELNTADPQKNNDWIDPLNAGFTVTSSAPAALNTSGGTYIFLAIA